jgi:hypothetical protein
MLRPVCRRRGVVANRCQRFLEVVEKINWDRETALRWDEEIAGSVARLNPKPEIDVRLSTELIDGRSDRASCGLEFVNDARLAGHVCYAASGGSPRSLRPNILAKSSTSWTRYSRPSGVCTNGSLPAWLS